jgi:hypothetical protein
MKALNLQHGFEGPALDISHTVATLDARGVFQVARRLACSVPGELGEALRTELDSLVETYADTVLSFDGYVVGEEYNRQVEEAKDARADEENAIEWAGKLRSSSVGKLRSDVDAAVRRVRAQFGKNRVRREVCDAIAREIEQVTP